MPFKSQRAKLVLDPRGAEPAGGAEHLLYGAGCPCGASKNASGIRGRGVRLGHRSKVGTNRPKVERTVDRALASGAQAALDDLPRPGRPREITSEARAWVVALACQKPKELGYPEELWTMRRLTQHLQSHCEEAGQPSLARVGRGTVSKILSEHELRPHKTRYYLERRDPAFERKMVEVLHVYREVRVLKAEQDAGEPAKLPPILSYDEKPGILAIGNVAPDRPPVPDQYPHVARDHEYERHGTFRSSAASIS